MPLEARPNVTPAPSKLHHGCPQFFDVHIAGVRIDSAGVRVPREEPDADSLVRPFHGVHTAISGIEAVAVVGRVTRSLLAPILAGAFRRGAVRGGDEGFGRHRRSALVHDAPVGGVEGHGVAGLAVDAFDDCDAR